MEEQKQDQIDRYIRGEMNPEECKCFERLLDEDVELREKYEFTKQMREALKSRSAKLRLMEQWNEESEQYSGGTVAGHSRRRILSVAGGFLLIAVLIIGIFLFVPSRWRTSSEKELPPLDMALYENYRSGSSIPQIVTLIRGKQYEKALQEIYREEKALSVPVDIQPVTDEERERWEYEAAATRLDADHLKWLKVYALIGLDRREEALKVLDEMRRSLGPYQQKADSLYRVLN